MKNIRYYVFFALDKIRGGKFSKNIKEIISANINFANYKEKRDRYLSDLLKHTTETVPFYKEFKNKTLNDFPIVDKGMYKQLGNSFLSERYKEEDLYKSSTSGSTGTPFVVYQDARKRLRLHSELIAYNAMIGQNVGDKFIFFRVWTDKNRKSKLEQIKQNLIPIDILHIDTQHIKGLVHALQKRGVKSTLGYASTYDAIANYLQENDMHLKTDVKVMMSSSEVLHESTREILTTRLDCAVIDRYSNQENGVIAQNVIYPNGNNGKLLVNQANYIIELLKIDSDEPVVMPNEVGRVVITDLFNYAMPIIRYDTGDLAMLSDESDENSMYLENIQGRRVDVIYDTKGNALTPHTWSVYMWKFDKLRQYQFIQNGEKDYVMKINVDDGVYDDSEIVALLKSILGADANIEIVHVNEIPNLKSGKFKKTICNYKKNAAK